MRELTRRNAVACFAAAAAAPAFVTVGAADDTVLLTAIRHYRDSVSNEALRGFEDDELDAAVTAAQKPLVALIDAPVLTAAGALAALDLLIAEYHVEVVNNYESEYMDIMTSLARSVRGYLASVA